MSSPTLRDFRGYGRTPPDREGASSPKMMSLGLHSRIIGHPARISGLERFLNHVAAHGDVWVCGQRAIADLWRLHNALGARA